MSGRGDRARKKKQEIKELTSDCRETSNTRVQSLLPSQSNDANQRVDRKAAERSRQYRDRHREEINQQRREIRNKKKVLQLPTESNIQNTGEQIAHSSNVQLSKYICKQMRQQRYYEKNREKINQYKKEVRLKKKMSQQSSATSHKSAAEISGDYLPGSNPTVSNETTNATEQIAHASNIQPSKTVGKQMRQQRYYEKNREKINQYRKDVRLKKKMSIYHNYLQGYESAEMPTGSNVDNIDEQIPHASEIEPSKNVCKPKQQNECKRDVRLKKNKIEQTPRPKNSEADRKYREQNKHKINLKRRIKRQIRREQLQATTSQECKDKWESMRSSFTKSMMNSNFTKPDKFIKGRKHFHFLYPFIDSNDQNPPENVDANVEEDSRREELLNATCLTQEMIEQLVSIKEQNGTEQEKDDATMVELLKMINDRKTNASDDNQDIEMLDVSEETKLLIEIFNENNDIREFFKEISANTKYNFNSKQQNELRLRICALLTCVELSELDKTETSTTESIVAKIQGIN